MDIDYQKLKSSILNPSLREVEVIRELKLLSESFTSKREKINNYVKSEDAISSYTLFYLPTNAKKLHYLLQQLPEWVLSDFITCNFIDFGTGPATYLLSFLDVVAEHKGKLFGIDNSELMLKQAKKIMENFHPGKSEVNFLHNISGAVTSERSILFFGNSINEVSSNVAEKLVDRVDPAYVMFIEPGTKESFAEILKLKRYLHGAGYHSIYPCGESIKCPKSGGDDWCHQVLRTTHSAQLERLSQLVAKDRRSMPFIGHLYAKQVVTGDHESNQFVVTRHLHETKFSFEWEICHKEKLICAELMKRGLEKRLIKELRKSSVGDKVLLKITKKITPEKWRVELMD